MRLHEPSGLQGQDPPRRDLSLLYELSTEAHGGLDSSKFAARLSFKRKRRQTPTEGELVTAIPEVLPKASDVRHVNPSQKARTKAEKKLKEALDARPA